jgi:predicted TIM-barrel fold metal-dependent hydrolase
MDTQQAISADSHVDLPWIPEDIFKEAAPTDLRDRVPTLIETPAGRQWTYPGRPWMGGAQGKPTGKGKNFERMTAGGFYDVDGRRFHPTDVELRLRDQDMDGLSGEVLYGILAVDGSLKDDPDVLTFVYTVYQDWVAHFVGQAPDRFAAIVPLPGNPEEAVAHVRRAAKLGIKGVELKPRIAIKPFWHDIWEPLWFAVEETGLVLNFHSDISLIQPKGTPQDREARRMVNQALIGSIGKMANAEYLGTMILSGVLERHPRISLVMGETDISWLPHYIDRMDYMVTEREYHTGLPLLPSEYWFRQCKATFQNEKLAATVIPMIGVDNVMWANDYPHPDGTWPASQQVFRDHLSSLSETDLHQVLYANVASLYGFAQPSKQALVGAAAPA